MSKRYLWNISVWTACWVGLYCFLYAISPLQKYDLICATFTALPIFLTSGAKRKDYVHYAASNVMGVVWGLIYLFLCGKLESAMPAPLGFGLGVLIVTLVLVSLHEIVLAKTWINIVPAIYGATSSTFWIKGDMQRVPALIITLICGVTLALICSEGKNFITPDGHWTLPTKKNKDQKES